MKKLFTSVFLLGMISGCNQKAPVHTTNFISGKDTAVLAGNFSVDFTKCRASSGWKDTVTGEDFYKFMRRDTAYIHDTIYTISKSANSSVVIGNANKVNIGQ
ncbi:MAG: hypothetical protein QM802_20155 [Agriterribacter sp.]